MQYKVDHRSISTQGRHLQTVLGLGIKCPIWPWYRGGKFYAIICHGELCHDITILVFTTLLCIIMLNIFVDISINMLVEIEFRIQGDAKIFSLSYLFKLMAI